MNKRFFRLVTVGAISCSLLFSSCIGPFALSNKLLSWNQTVSDKFVNAIIFAVLSPVYVVTLIGDSLLFNTIEFWSGENPIEAGVVKKVQGDNGVYTVETLENGYKIEDEAGQISQFIYDRESNTWSLVANEKTTKLITISDDNKSAIVYLPNGEERNVELSDRGVLALQQYVENSQVYFAAK
jgi:hypothetical protein